MGEAEEQLDEKVFRAELAALRQWGRWGDDDQRGAINLITPEKILRALSLVTDGHAISLSRVLATEPSPNNPQPAQHYLRVRKRGERGEGSVVDFVGVGFHGKATTHVDALCHVWNHDGMWNGRDPRDSIDYERVRWGDIDNWKDGIVTRGVLLDVARERPAGFVDRDAPVTGDELARLADKDDLRIEPGDALLIHSGREAWDRTHDRPWGSPDADGVYRLAGLHSSCLEFFRDTDCSMVVWDMMDAVPNRFGVPHSTHAAIFTLGIALLDNAVIEPLALRCRESGRRDFLIVVAPLRIAGGTGSPVNPLVLL